MLDALFVDLGFFNDHCPLDVETEMAEYDLAMAAMVGMAAYGVIWRF